MSDQLKKAIQSILKDDAFSKLFFNSISFIKPSFRRIICLLAFGILIFLLYIKVFVNYIDGVTSALEIINNVNAIINPIFAVIITGYAIFQALTNGRTLVALFNANENERSKFQEYNYFFFAISILYLFIIVANFILTIVFINLPSNWHFPYFHSNTNNIVFSFLMSFYICFIVNALIEIKSFIYNLYQLFSVHAVASTIEHYR